ncbi:MULTISPECIES: hypothetical protein [unclassified Streptomyces]|uniref:hypothetical protein n=1 Tax=unclassified Streptomyces TaxID=2593676 RepID=UPI003D74FF78
MTAPFLLLIALGLGTWLVFQNTVVLGLVLMAAGLLGLLMFMGTVAGHQRPGENETVIEERHYIGRSDDDHRRFRG